MADKAATDACNPADPEGKLSALCRRMEGEFLSGCGATVEPYLTDHLEARFRVSVQTFDRRTVAVGHLQPGKAHGHTYYLFAAGIRSAYEDGIKEGLRLAKERLMERLVGPTIDGSLR